MDNTDMEKLLNAVGLKEWNIEVPPFYLSKCL